MELTGTIAGQRMTGNMSAISSVIHFVCSPTEKNNHIQKIMLHTTDKVEVIDLEEVVYAMANRGYSEILTVAGKKYISAKTLADYESLLSPIPYFTRANKSYIINVNHVRCYTKGPSCCIFMRGSDDEIEVSRRKKRDIMGLLRHGLAADK